MDDVKMISGRVRLGREYLRVSYDRSGRERSQDEQHDDNTAALGPLGVTLGASYREAGSASASRYAQKVRDDFERLLADLEGGRFGAEVLVLWESSRGSRKVGEWVTLIELCEQQNVTIFVTTHGREYVPGNPRDRRSLLEDAVDSEYESAKVSARATRSAAANARDGKPHGPVPYGYVRRYDERTRRFLAQEPDPVKAEVIKELFARLMAGHSFRSISRDFAQRGFVNLSGDPFSPGHLRVLAVNPAYTGLRVHRPTKQNPGRLHATVRSGENTEAVWPALVSRADFMAVQRILGDPKRVTTRPGGAKHLLSMIARCDVCGGVLVVTLRNRASGEYQCGKGGHVRCDKLELDALAEDAILGYLARRDVYTDITAGEDQASAELGQVRADLASARHELDDLRARVGAGRLSLDSLVVAEPLILARIKGLEQQENTLATPSALRGLIEPGPDVAERWEQMPISARRTVARVLLVPERLGQLRVEPRPADYPRSVRQPVKERVVWSQNDPQDDPQEPGAADS